MKFFVRMVSPWPSHVSMFPIQFNCISFQGATFCSCIWIIEPCIRNTLQNITFSQVLEIEDAIYSPSSLVTHSEERYITIFRMQNNSQIIICENISRRWSALTLRFCSSHACFYYTLFPFLTCFRVPHGWPSTTQDRPRTHEWSGALLAYSIPLTLRPQRFG